MCVCVCVCVCVCARAHPCVCAPVCVCVCVCVYACHFCEMWWSVFRIVEGRPTMPPPLTKLIAPLPPDSQDFQVLFDKQRAVVQTYLPDCHLRVSL